MATGTFITQEFDTYADTQVAGALGSKKKYVVVKSNENKDGAWCLYFFDGDVLQVIYEPGADDAPSAFTPTKDYFTASGGETEISITGIDSSFVSMVWQGMTPLVEYNGADPVPASRYKVAADKILLGDAAGADEIFTIIKFG